MSKFVYYWLPLDPTSAISAALAKTRLATIPQLLGPPCCLETRSFNFLCLVFVMPFWGETPILLCFCLFFHRHLDGDSGGTRGGIHHFRTPGAPIRRIPTYTGLLPCLVPSWPQIMQIRISFRSRSDLILDADHALNIFILSRFTGVYLVL